MNVVIKVCNGFINFFKVLNSDLFCLVSDLYKMVCPENSTALNISIPAVMIPKSGGEKLNNSLSSGKKGKFEFLHFYILFFLNVDSR